MLPKEGMLEREVKQVRFLTGCEATLNSKQEEQPNFQQKRHEGHVGGQRRKY